MAANVKIVWLHKVVFSDVILDFWDNVHLFQYYPVQEYLKIALILLITQIKPIYKFSNFLVQ